MCDRAQLKARNHTLFQASLFEGTHSYLRATSHTRPGARDHYTSSTLIGGNGGAGPSFFTLHLRDRRSMWMQDGCKVYMDSYMASNGVMFRGRLDYFQKPRDRGIPNAHNCGFILLYHAWGPAWINIIEIAFGWGPGHMWLHITFEGPWPHYMILEVCWDGRWTRSFGLSQFHGHGS
jgi:hypothetical protein